MFSKITFLILAAIFSSSAFAAKQVVKAPLDFSLTSGLPLDHEMVYGYSSSLFNWVDWSLRPSSGPLLVPRDPPREDLELFEARSAGIVKQPISIFTESFLNNIETVRRLDPQNSHEEKLGNIDKSTGKTIFTVETTVKFPKSWSDKIAEEKSKGRFAHTTDKLIIGSEFTYVDLRKRAIDPYTASLINKLSIYGPKTPDIISIHALRHINQIAKFGSMISFFYELDSGRTLVVNYFVLGIREKYLVGAQGLLVRLVLLGEALGLNSDDGIGAGLPKYVERLFRAMFEGLE